MGGFGEVFMVTKRCSAVKKGKKICSNPAIEGFNFCKSHIDQIDSVIRYRVPNYILLESSENGQGFIFNSHLGNVYYLNTSGAYIFSLMKENKPLSEITRAVSKRYGTDPIRVLSDFRDFYDNLMYLGLILPYEEL